MTFKLVNITNQKPHAQPRFLMLQQNDVESTKKTDHWQSKKAPFPPEDKHAMHASMAELLIRPSRAYIYLNVIEIQLFKLCIIILELL